jgi:hypothetical protein
MLGGDAVVVGHDNDEFNSGRLWSITVLETVETFLANGDKPVGKPSHEGDGGVSICLFVVCQHS